MILLGLDLSTSATGWCLFNIKTKKLLKYGVLKATARGLLPYAPLHKKLIRLERMARQVDELIKTFEDVHTPDFIVIEEITGSKNRIGQKLLDGQHWILLQQLHNYLRLNLIFYYDVSGAVGWRTDLKLKLTVTDKIKNKQSRQINKIHRKDQIKIKIIGYKHLSCRFVSKKFSLNLDCDIKTTDGDIADSIAMTYAFITFRFPKGII